MNQEEIMDMIIDHYENPRNYGELGTANIIQEGGNQGCGDIIQISIATDPGGNINDIRFSGEGCMISQAATSLIIEKMKGKSIDQIEGMSPEIVRDILGNKIVGTRPRCAMLGFNTLKNAMKQVRRDDLRSRIENSK